LRRLVWMIAVATVVILGGFVAFVESLPKPTDVTVQPSDGIVALTGEGRRLMPAMDLLEKGLGRRLLITGVNPASKGALRSVLHGGALFDCCVDLGFAALDTRGNAQEAASWVKRNRYSSLIIVTADYHMPRSLVEFGSEMPGIKLTPYPVPDNANSGFQAARRLSGEYFKFLASSVRAFFIRVIQQARQ
jgi:uncharacterized SAM-binding protein YcdF (DUF218 family)